MKPKIFKKSSFYFTNLFLTLTALTAVIILALSFFLYFNFINYGIEIINKSNEKRLSDIGNSAVQMNDYVKVFSSSLFTNETSVQLMLGNNISLFDAQSSIRKIDTTLSSAPFIYSAYFYNGGTNTFYTVGPQPIIRQREMFFDKEIVSILDNISNYNILQPIARRISAGDITPSESADVFTYIMPELNFSDGKVKNALILNVKADWIFNIIKSSNKETSITDNNILIVDEKGTVLGDTQNQLYLKNISDLPYIHNILNSTKASGYFLDSVNGKKSVITYVNILPTHWKLLSMTSYSYVLRPINEVKFITLLICIIELFLGILAAFILSKKLYTPVDQLRKNVEQMLGKHAPVEEKLNEFEMISKNVASTLNVLSSLQTFKNSNLNLLKQEFLKKILLENKEYGDDCATVCREYDIQINTSNTLRVLIFRIDHYLATFSRLDESTQSLYKFALANIASEIIYQQFKCEAVDMGNDHIAVIISTEQEGSPCVDFDKTITSLVNDVKETYLRYYQISFSVGIGHWCTSLDSLNNSYKSALEISNYRICRGHGCILFAGDSEISLAEELSTTNNNYTNLLDSLKKARLEDIERYFSIIIKTLYNCKYSNIMFSISYLASSVFNTLSTMEKNNIVAFDDNYLQFSERIHHMDTLEEIDGEFRKLFHMVIRKLMDSKDDKSSFIAENIIKYIEANYTDPNLSSNTIADLFNLTPAYISKLFRDYTFKSISDYITDLRLSKAQELLISTDYTIDEIIDRINWDNKNYFFTLFKKRFGATPTQYRLKASISDINRLNP